MLLETPLPSLKSPDAVRARCCARSDPAPGGGGTCALRVVRFEARHPVSEAHVQYNNPIRTKIALWWTSHQIPVNWLKSHLVTFGSMGGGGASDIERFWATRPSAIP